jgi:2-oxoglutarate dehydrogenase E2 component (dihydrolipoamide succinyltransferase)
VAIDVRIPELGESVSEATIVRWLKNDGDSVQADEPLLEIETEKAAMEIQAERAGRLHVLKSTGERVTPGTVVATIDEAAVPATAAVTAAPGQSEPEPPSRPAVPPEEAAPRAERAPRAEGAQSSAAAPPPELTRRPEPAPPSDGEHADSKPQRAPQRERPDARRPANGDGASDADVERVPMTTLRRTIAARLVEAQRTAAILTTFNEVDLGELQALRARHRERFKARHGVDLGLMSLFSRAVIHALREVPILNARIDGSDVVHWRRVHLGIAVSTPRGLVVPVVRDADRLSLPALEQAIGDVARRARDGKIAPDDLAGGTFTITNGGVFGSLLSTPILNPPQSGILGMHKIEDRPVAREGQVVIRPMMYVALSYDHRLVDGAQAVTFLVRVKEALEDPARMVLEV